MDANSKKMSRTVAAISSVRLIVFFFIKVLVLRSSLESSWRLTLNSKQMSRSVDADKLCGTDCLFLYGR